jgi:hypothetical protein
MATQDDITRLQANLAAINDAIATGEKQTVISGESITYRSIAELEAARTIVTNDLAAAMADVSGTRPRPRRTLLRYGGREYNDWPYGGSGRGNW